MLKHEDPSKLSGLFLAHYVHGTTPKYLKYLYVVKYAILL